MKSSENQFVKLPTKKSVEKSDLVPEEELVYIGLRSFINGTTKQCNPSYKSIADRLKIKDLKTVSKYLESLQDKGYIKIIKSDRGRKNSYIFIKDLPNFEQFKLEFIQSEELTFQQKAFLTSIQRLQYKDKETGFGNITFQELEIADKINKSFGIVNKRLKELEEKGIVTITKTNTIDSQTGLIKKLYSFDLSKYNPIIKVLLKHEMDIQDIISVLTPEQKQELENRRKQREFTF